MDQLSFASLDFAAKKKRTKRDVFLAEMAAVVPWAALEGVIEPHYPKTGPQGGRRPFPLAMMLRIYCLQQWYNLSDPGAEEALYDIQSMRAFCGLELGRDAIPDETTILNFRHLLERHDLTKAVFAAVAEHLEARGADAARRHDRGRDADRGLAVDEEPAGQARSRDAFLQEGEPVVLRHEGARRRGCEERAGAHRGCDDGQRPRRQGDAPPDPRRRPRRVRRQGLCQRCAASGPPKRPASNGR